MNERIVNATKACCGWVADHYRIAIGSDSVAKRTPIYIDCSYPIFLGDIQNNTTYY